MNFAVILSGGIGSRMKGIDVPKQYLEFCGKSILAYTLEIFENNSEIDRIIIVANEVWHKKIIETIKKCKISKFQTFAMPGETRQESIRNGLEKCLCTCFNDKVVVHDAVRPLVSSNLISKCLSMLSDYDGCMPVLSVNDTIYFSKDGETIDNLLDRSTLYAGQSPEAFNLKKYREINFNATKEVLMNIRGSSEIAFLNGLNIALIPGEDSNFKITTIADLERFKVIVEKESKG